jgi:hypothetical protein
MSSSYGAKIVHFERKCKFFVRKRPATFPPQSYKKMYFFQIFGAFLFIFRQLLSFSFRISFVFSTFAPANGKEEYKSSIV